MPPRANVNKIMKKFLPIIIGVFVGIAVSAAMMLFKENFTVYGEENSAGWWNEFIAGADQDWFDWEDVFNPLGASERGKDIYNLVYKKQTREANNDALNAIANNFGLTVEEAQAVIGGSVTPLFNNPKFSGTNLSLEEAYAMMADFQSDFETLQEVFQIQQEIDLAVKPSEIFSNDDISDSGFDLVHDLSVIEDILFLEGTPITVGGVYEEGLDSPYNPAELEQLTDSYPENETDVATFGLGAEVISGEAVPGEIMEEDLCSEHDSLGRALKDLKKEEDAKAAEEKGKKEGGDEDGSESGGGGDSGEGKSKEEDKETEKSKASSVSAAPKDEWRKEWCPGFGTGAPGSAEAAPSSFGSLGGESNPYLSPNGAGYDIDSAALSAHVGVCFDIKYIMQHVSSYIPGSSCILCEVEKINEYLDKTLSHSLIPNKVTGNYFESAKCKKTGTLLNMQFILVWNPIPTPINDTLIFGKNIFEEWNKFTERYKPILASELKFDIPGAETQSDDFITQFQSKFVQEGASQRDLLNEITDIKNKNTTKAKLSVKNVEFTSEASNMMVYSNVLSNELKQMNNLFAAFKGIFANIDSDALQKIKAKPSK
ncbi:MAG: hypothetical protein AAB540_02125 [Patescibacteria group bacterium]